MHLDHVALQVTDALASLAFYRDVLGLSLVGALTGDDWNGHPWLMMLFDDHSGGQIALTALRGQAARPEPTDIVHYAFAVESLASYRERLRAAKVEFSEEDHGDQKSLYFKDPTGHTLEITVRPRGSGDAKTAARVIENWLAVA